MRFTNPTQGRTLSFYILRTHAGPFLFSVSTLMFLFLLQFVMKFIDQLVGKGLSAWTIIELISLNLAWMVVLAVPMSVLVATLMAFGDLSSRNEVTAMKASGVSIYRMMAPVFFAAAILASLLVLFNNYVLPEANHRAKTLAIDIRRKRPTLSLVAGLFSQDISGYSILVRKTFEKTNDLEGITIYDYTDPNTNIVVTAKKGTVSFTPDYRKLVMNLQDGEIHELDAGNMSAYRRIKFETHRIAMAVEGFEFERSSASAFSRSDRELSAKAMNIIVDSLQLQKDQIEQGTRDLMARYGEHLLTGKPEPPNPYGAGFFPAQGPDAALSKARRIGSIVGNELLRIQYLDKQIDQYDVEIYKKYSIPAACLVFVLVGAPLGIMARRGGFGIAATLSFGFFLMYWAFLIGGEKLADRDIASPFWGMWSANFLIGVLGIYLTMRIGKESVMIDWGWFSRFLPKRWRTDVSEEQARSTYAL